MVLNMKLLMKRNSVKKTCLGRLIVAKYLRKVMQIAQSLIVGMMYIRAQHYIEAIILIPLCPIEPLAIVILDMVLFVWMELEVMRPDAVLARTMAV